MSDLAALPTAVRSYVQDYVARGRRLALIRRAGIALALLIVWALLWCGVDRFIQLAPAIRLAALLTGAAGALAMLARPLGRWLARETDWVNVAQEIERLEPRFGQRLVTVTSRLLGRPEHRGSDEILEHLVYQVDREVSEQRSALLLPLRTAAAGWLLGLLALAVGTGLCFVPGVGLPRLAARFAAPWADLPPVTTASLRVYPGDLDVPQSNPVQIDADAQRIGAGQVWLNVSDDGKTWSRSAMTAGTAGPNGDGRYSFTIAAVDRDLQYVVSGGDAKSPHYSIRVLRRPAVSEFNIRYTYPAYTGKPPLTVSNVDGVIEAPVGTEAQLTITSTEPLEMALFTGPGGEKTLLSRAGAENIRQGRFTVQREGRYQLDLVSTREVTGSGPKTTEIRAQVDRPPAIHLAEGGATLRLNPRDVLPLSYDAMDDYGIDSVSVRVQYGANQSVDLPIYPDVADASLPGSGPMTAALTAGPAAPATREVLNRRIAGQFDLDLAGLPLTMGDVLSIVVSTKDTGGQSTSAAPVQVLVSPRSVGPETYDRMDDLSDASRLADALAEELAAAIAPLSGGLAQRDRHLSAALETCAMVRRALLRAVAHGASPTMCVAIAQWLDKAQAITSRVSDLLDSQASADNASGIDGIRNASALSREIQSKLKTLSQGERAAAILADRESAASIDNHSAPGDGREAERLKQTLQRIREDITAAASEIGLDAAAGDFEVQLRSKVAGAESAVASGHVIDFASIAREWARRPPSAVSQPNLTQAARLSRDGKGEVSQRLLVAAEAEAVRRDCDLVRSRDLQLASRAAAALGAEPPAKMNDLAEAMSALQQDHQLNRRAGDAPRMDRPEDVPVRQAAERARQQLESWAGEAVATATRRANPPGTSPAVASARAENAESLALRAGAESAHRRYADAAETDRALRQAVERIVTGDRNSTPEASSERSDAQLAQQARIEQTSQDVSRSMKSAEKIDGLAERQEKLNDETRHASDETAQMLAERQRGVADQISQLTPARPAVATAGVGRLLSNSQDPNWRERAVGTVLAAQVQLSSMPRQLAEAMTAAEEWRRAADRAKSAHRDADAAAPDHKPAAARAAEQADQDVAEALQRLTLAAAPLAPQAGQALGLSLMPFAPDTAAARSAVESDLLPSLKSMGEAMRGEDADAAGRSAAGVRQAIETVQVALAGARDDIAQRDPLVAAKWFARAAADALGRKPPDFPLALKDQDLTAAALARAWDASVHHAAALRLAELPALHALYAPVPIRGEGARLAAGAPRQGNAATPGASAAPTLAGNYRRLDARGGESSATPHQADPAGYEAALRAYFEALGNADPGKSK